MSKKDSPLQSTTTNYSKELDKALDKLGEISIWDFAKQFSTPDYLETISWDPTTAKFWNELNDLSQTEKPPKTSKNEFLNDPFNQMIAQMAKVPNFANKLPKSSIVSFKLNQVETDILKKYGFVISKRIKRGSFGESFYEIYSADLPVFVSADAILHAWYHSYEAVIEELEETYFSVILADILSAMAEQVPTANQEYGDGVLKDSLQDVDYFIATAHSLLKGATGIMPNDILSWEPPFIFNEWMAVEDKEANVCKLISNKAGKTYIIDDNDGKALAGFLGGTVRHSLEKSGVEVEPNIIKIIENTVKKFSAWGIFSTVFLSSTHFDQEQQVNEMLGFISKEQIQNVPLFGKPRDIDFSLFKPRAKYTKTELLQRYFRAMIWLGHIDLRIAGEPEDASERELGVAIVLHDLLKKSGKFSQWQQFNSSLEKFFGKVDSMTFNDLDKFLTEKKINSPKEITDKKFLQRLQADINETTLGLQEINSGLYDSPANDQQKLLPRSFTFMGQRFSLDSWAMGKVVYDRVYWNGGKVQRRIASSLDVAFSVLGNTQVSPYLISQIANNNGRKFRDGLPYQHNLTAVKQVIDKQEESIWEESLYSAWLATLRVLSLPTTSSQYPEAMRTEAWAMRTLNTQLASWTQLKHASVLYMKQTTSFGTRCMYPAGYVEPRADFWHQFGKMARLGAKFIEEMPELDLPSGRIDFIYQTPILLSSLRKNQLRFFNTFIEHLDTLEEIARKELSKTPLSEYETQFLEGIVEIRQQSGGPMYTGWYHKLFYVYITASTFNDLIVADVFTDAPDYIVDDPGCILHQAIGYPNMMVMAVEQDSNEDKMIYVGPVYSYYEFEMPINNRKTDSEWEAEIKAKKDGEPVPRPYWIKKCLA